MFERFRTYFYPSDNVNFNSHKEKNTFTTSEDITKQVNPADKGICGPTANSYTEYQMGKRTHEFMEGTPQQIYNNAAEVRKHQEDLLARHQDGLHNAFVDNKVNYEPVFHNINDLKTPEGVEKATSKGSHSILTFQAVGEEKNLHQVALGRDFERSGQCYFFDSNLPGGERRGDCHRLFTHTAETIKTKSHPQAEKILVATDKTNNRL